MKLFLDTEFNGFGGELISLALVAEDHRATYIVVDCPNPEPWVADHVIPILYDCPITPFKPTSKEELARHVTGFLNLFSDEQLVVLADWSDDMRLFHECLSFGDKAPRVRHFVTSIVQVDNRLSDFNNEVPHNAWWDALAYREAYRANYGLT